MGRRPWFLFGYAALIYGFLFAPIFYVIGNSLNRDPLGLHWRGFTDTWFVQAWTADGVIQAARNSFEIAAASTALSLILGTLAAITLQNSRRWVKLIVNGSTFARIIMPELVLAVAVLVALKAIGFQRGMSSIILGHMLFSSAYVTVIVSSRLVDNDRRTGEAARDLGATAWRAFRRVTLPEIAPALVASGLLVFTFSLDDVVSSVFLSGSTVTLPLYLFGLIRFDVSPMVNALGTSMMAVTGLLLLIFAALNRRLR